jgi:hypothetical protein
VDRVAATAEAVNFGGRFLLDSKVVVRQFRWSEGRLGDLVTTGTTSRRSELAYHHGHGHTASLRSQRSRVRERGGDGRPARSRVRRSRGARKPLCGRWPERVPCQRLCKEPVREVSEWSLVHSFVASYCVQARQNAETVSINAATPLQRGTVTKGKGIYRAGHQPVNPQSSSTGRGRVTTPHSDVSAGQRGNGGGGTACGTRPGCNSPGRESNRRGPNPRRRRGPQRR